MAEPEGAEVGHDIGWERGAKRGATGLPPPPRLDRTAREVKE